MEITRESIRDRVIRLSDLLSRSTTEVKPDNGAISREMMLDSLLILYDECNNEFLMKDPLIAEFVEKYRSTVLRLRDFCVGISDFDWHKVISVGRFAEVTVVKEKNTNNVYVAKRLKKSDILNSHETIHFENEKNVLLAAAKHNEARKWVPQLFYSFHNLKYIYYIMEYCPGGNLYTMLEYYKKNVPESMLRFYMAEMVQAIFCIHNLGFAHRDIKPDNITIDSSGHLKLIDFGSSAKIPKNGLINTKLSLIMPHYAAPEVFKFHDNLSKGYNAQCDWWSLGIVLFELTTGSVPFTSDEVPKLYLSPYMKKLQYPKLVDIPSDLKNIINNLLQPVDKRLNYEKIKRLDYFSNINWQSLHKRDPLFLPSLSCPEDTTYFTTYESQRPTPKVEDFKLQRRFTGRGLRFLGFTYLGDSSCETIQSHTIETQSKEIVRGRRKTEDYKLKSIPESKEFVVQRHSIDSATRLSEAASSEFSNDSYESATSVRLENEVNQLHSFYNEKALIIEDKLKTRFHDLYSCMTEDQQKILREKEELMIRVNEMEKEFAIQLKEITNKTKELEHDRENLRGQIKELNEANDDLKGNYEEQLNKLKKTDKLKKDAIAKLNGDLQKLNQELTEKTTKLRETEEKLLNVSNQQAAKLAMLNRTKTTLRSRSEERDKYEHENVSLKSQLSEANKKIARLTSDLEKKNKLKLDLELKMTAKDKNGERTFMAQNSNEKSPVKQTVDTDQLVKQITNSVRDILKENLSKKGDDKTPDIEKMIGTIQNKISLLNDNFKPICKSDDKSAVESTVITVLHSQIEHLQSQVKKAEETSSFHRDTVDQLRKELSVNEKQLTDAKIELCVAQREVKVLEEQIKVLQTNKVDSEKLMNNFQSTIKEVIEENLSHKTAAKNPDFEGMFNKVQRKLSILSEGQAKKLETETKPNSSNECTNVQVLQAQIERLEVQMEKARERAILSREEATQAKSKLAISEKQLSDLKIDLRIAQRETKDAENQINELEKQLKSDTHELVSQLEELRQKLEQRELVVVTLKNQLDAKTNEVKLHESSLEDKTSVIKSLSRELQTMKTKIENSLQEKAKVETENKKYVHELTKLKVKVEQLENVLKKNESNVNQIQQKENEWKSKYEKIKTEVDSLRETCEIQDRINVGFETSQKKLEDEVKRCEEEKIKLQVELDSVCEELKCTRKSVNEEKSLRAVTEDRVRKLQEGLRLQEEEIRALEEIKKEKLHEILVLEEKVRQFEDCIFETNDSVEKSTQYIELLRKEVYSLKEERTELLTRLHRLKEEKMSLQNELTEAIEEINHLQQINGESQVVLDQIKAYYEDRHMKDTATLHQYSKLNEFLQTKVYDATKQKRTFTDKFFRSKYKENLNPKEIENLLYLERKKNKELADQLYQTKTEMIMQRNNENSSSTKCSSPKSLEYESCISATPTLSSKIRSAQSNNSENEPLLCARMNHNIPHKFETKLCKKLGIKCVACGQAVTFGHMSQCKECHVRCHVACSVKIGPTCGLSKLLMNQLPITTPNKSQSSTSLGSSVKSDVEGHVRVLKDKSWERKTITVDDKNISLYEKTSKQQREPYEKINFSMIVDVDDHVDRDHVALENVSDLEKRCLFRIIYRTPHKYERILHLLALNESDKINWINIIRRNLPTVPKHTSFEFETKNRSRGTIICEFAEQNTLVINQMISLLPELTLMATDDGLYSLKTDVQNDQPPNKPVRINGVDKVTRMKILAKSRLVLFICGEDDLVKKCDLRMLLSNAEAAACSLPNITIEDVSSITPINDCQLLEASSCNSLLAIATTNRLVILKSTEMGFDDVTYDKEISGVKSMIFTPHCLLYCTHSEIFRINLKNYEENKLEVFKRCPDGDTKCQQSLKAIVKITRELYLVCNQLFGVFVNAEGRKKKNSEMLRWPLRPERIVYNKPFLCLGHESNISLVYLPCSGEESEKKFKFSIIPYCKPSILGIIKEPVNGEYMKDPVRGIFIEDEKEEGNRLLYFLDPIAFTRHNPKDSWSSIDTQLTGETTDEECVRKSLNISNETDLSLNSSVLDESCDEQSS